MGDYFCSMVGWSFYVRSLHVLSDRQPLCSEATCVGPFACDCSPHLCWLPSVTVSIVSKFDRFACFFCVYLMVVAILFFCGSGTQVATFNFNAKRDLFKYQTWPF